MDLLRPLSAPPLDLPTFACPPDLLPRKVWWKKKFDLVIFS